MTEGSSKIVLAPEQECAHAYPMKGYGQFCPVALAAEVFAERWTPLILRELLSGAAAFREHPSRRAPDLP
jgi:DNA-binding HxlR family transcriptional regulator